MIETDPQTENDLREAVRLATSYATDFLRAENVKGFGNIPSEQFVVRCHEGFDIAQKLILKNILTLEKRLKELRTDFQERSKEKKKKEIQRDDVLRELREEENRVVGVSNAFRRVADTMVWQILSMNKVLMRSTHTGHGSRGYLSDTNIASDIEAIAQLRKPSEFYLINDLTLCLGSGAGDLLHVRADRSCAFVELKTGVENIRILDFLHGFEERVDQQRARIADGTPPRSPEECPLHEFLGANIDLLTDKGKRKQIDRVVRQMERMHAVLGYDRTNLGKDISLTAKGKPVARNRVAYVPETKDEHAFAEIREVLTTASQKPPHFAFLDYGPILTFLVTDNLKSQLFSPRLSPFARAMNARHIIYHHIHENLAECGYARGPLEGAEEFKTYSRMFVLDWATQVLGDGSLMPPFLMPFERDLIFDVLFGRKSIFAYFDRTAFAEYVTEAAAGKFVLKSDGPVDHEMAGLQIQIVGRKGRQGASMIGWGLIFRMLIEFQDPETLCRQIVEGVHRDEKLALERPDAVNGNT
jgi:hypothetical protein